jgi:hypothetical protein
MANIFTDFNIIRNYVIEENIAELDKIFDGKRLYDLEKYLMDTCIIYSKPELYRYYKNKGFVVSGYGVQEQYLRIHFKMKTAIQQKSLTMSMVEEIRKEIDNYTFTKMVLTFLEYSLDIGNIEFARTLYYTYKEICDSHYFDIVLVYVIQKKVNDLFLEFVKKTTDMKNVRIWADAYQNAFVLNWLYETGQMVETGYDPYKRILSYELVGSQYKFLLSKYGLEYNGVKVPQTIYKDYMNSLMKLIV